MMIIRTLVIVLLINIFKCYCQSSSERRVNINSRSVFDENLYANVLDPVLCHQQLEFLSTNGSITRLMLSDAGFRFPRGIFQLNFQDWGNYYQCLDINHEFQNIDIQGKYCSIRLPLQQNVNALSEFTSSSELNEWSEILFKKQNLQNFNKIETIKYKLLHMMPEINITPRVQPESPLAGISLTLAMCIPKVCTLQEFIDFRLPSYNLNYNELFCRLPNDKPFSHGDYVAITIFSIFGLLIILSTSYDLHQTIVRNKKGKEINRLLYSFSIYTNTRRLLTFKSTDGSLDSIDGIRALSMLWIIIGHTMSMSFTNVTNISDLYEWIMNIRSVWLLAVPLSVDSFLTMSGLLLVYTTAMKFNRKQFLSRLHYFYILRYLRIFPLLAAVVLLQATLFNHVSDGPWWRSVGTQTESCRTYWWSTLLHVQNYVNPLSPCIGVLWYLSVEMQLYWISPLILVWVLSDNRRVAWGALHTAAIIFLIIGAVISFVSNLPATPVALGRFEELDRYMSLYYVNTLTRASPFFIGMILGYLLHLCRGKKVKISKFLVIFYWMLAVGVSSFVFFISQPVGRDDYDNQILDNFLNAFMRPLWAAALGWVIFACVHGYGGPVNWFLSLRIWKLPARLSFAMYIFHYPLLFIFHGSLHSPLYFSIGGMFYRFLSDVTLTFLISVIVTLAVEYPFNNLQTLVIGNGIPKTAKSIM